MVKPVVCDCDLLHIFRAAVVQKIAHHTCDTSIGGKRRYAIRNTRFLLVYEIVDPEAVVLCARKKPSQLYQLT
jgi:hypothetical protein